MERGNAGLLDRNADRRDTSRHNVRIAVLALTDRGLSWLCQVTDFSAEAVSVRYPASREPAVRAWLDSGERAIRLQFHHGAMDRWHTIPGRVVRSGPGFMVIRFDGDALQGFEALLAQAGIANERPRGAMDVMPSRSLSAAARGRQAEVAVRQVVTPPLPSLIDPDDMRHDALGELVMHEAIGWLHDDAREADGFPQSLVPELIRALGESPRMTGRGRALLEWLQPIIERVLARSPDALSTASHPLRQLLNRIGHLETADHESPGPWPEAFLQILRARELPDMDGLVRASEVLGVELEGREANYQRNLRRVTKAVAGSERLREAEAATDRALDARLLGGPIPLAVLRFVESEWRNRLVLLHLHEGESGGAWQQALELLDRLLAHHQSSSTGDPVIRSRLEGLCADDVECDRALGALTLYLQAPGEEELVRLSEGFAREPEEEPMDQRLRQWVPSLEALTMGSWFIDAGSGMRPLRLAWTNPRRRRFVLVTPSGRKQYDLAMPEFARLVADGELVPVSRQDQSLVDEGLGRLMDSLYEQRIQERTTDPDTGGCTQAAFMRWLERSLHSLPLDRDQALVVLRWDTGADADIMARALRGTLGSDRRIGRAGARQLVFRCHREGLESWLVTVMERCNALVADGGNHVCAGVAVGDPAIVTSGRWYQLAMEAARQAPLENPPAFRFASVPAERSRYIRRLVDRLAGNGLLRRDELMLQAQRIIPLHGATRMAAQYELLMTLPDEHGTLMTAQELIPLAERFAGARNLDDWLMQSVLDCLSRPMKALPEADAGICIPVLGYTLTEPGLVRFIHEVFRIQPCPVERLWFCVSNADALADPDTVALFMREVRELGCRICLDADETDAGLAQLVRRLPVDLIRVGARNPSDDGEGHDAMLGAVVTVAHRMGAEVIVSGVHRPERIERLRALGADYAQGSAIARPRLLHH
ncbi:MAG: DUF1631 family protein [Pseudomonadota bacterium]